MYGESKSSKVDRNFIIDSNCVELLKVQSQAALTVVSLDTQHPMLEHAEMVRAAMGFLTYLLKVRIERDKFVEGSDRATNNE